MSAGAQLITVEKLIDGFLTNITDLKSQAADHQQRGLDVTGLHTLVSDAEQTLQYLNEVLEALQFAVGGNTHQA